MDTKEKIVVGGVITAAIAAIGSAVVYLNMQEKVPPEEEIVCEPGYMMLPGIPGKCVLIPVPPEEEIPPEEEYVPLPEEEIPPEEEVIPELVCTPNKEEILEYCPDGITVKRKRTCNPSGTGWIYATYDCPPTMICTPFPREEEILEYCPDGVSVKRKRICSSDGMSWYPETIYECPPPPITYYFEYLSGVINQKTLVIPEGFPYIKASEIVLSIEGGLGEGTNTKINTIFKRLPDGTGEIFYYMTGFAPGWKGVDFQVAVGDTIIIGYVSSFSWIVGG